MSGFHSHHPHSGHDHGHAHGHHHGAHESDPAAQRRALLRALAATGLFAFVEIAGGWISNSLALLSDGVHMLADAGALIFSLFTLWLAARPARKRFTYGFQRVEILGALLSGLVIWLIAGFLIYESIHRFADPPAVGGVWVFWIATVGLVSNLVSMKFLHASQSENLNIRAAYLHLVTDCLGSVAAMISGAVIALTDWRLIDPIVTCVFAALMLWSSWRLIREAVGVLMESAPAHLDAEEIGTALRGLPGVSSLHDLHVWTLSSGTIALSVHLRSGAIGGVLSAANALLSERFGITHTTIQIESESGDAFEGCENCAWEKEE